MGKSPLHSIVQHLRTALGPDAGGLTDGELLGRYVQHRDEAAIAALVRRHAPLVWGVCRRILRCHQDAEDAFQAAFLVLVHKAALLRDRSRVAGWLYGVAYRTAVRLRVRAAKQGRRERQLDGLPEPAAATAAARDLRDLLDRELMSLPERFRVLIVLCDLEGKTRKEAARQLGCPEGTVASRLARARQLLARRLRRHGVLSGVAGLAATLAGEALCAAVPAGLASAVSASARQAVAGGIPPGALSAYSDRGLTAMFPSKLMFAACAAVAAALLTVGGFLLATTQPGDGLEAGPPAPAARPAAKDEVRLEGSWRKVSLEIDGRKNARFGNIEPLYIFQGDQFTLTDDYDNVSRRGIFKVVPAARALDLLVTEGPDKGTTLRLRYECTGDRLRLASDRMTNKRPGEMRTAPGSAVQIYTFRREEPRKDDAEQIQGTWTVTSHDTLGKSASPAFLARQHQWIFAGDTVTIRDKEGIADQGTFHLDLTTKPRALDLVLKPCLKPGADAAEPQAKRLRCIYLLQDGYLTICYRQPGAARPARFESRKAMGTSVVILRREAAPKGNKPASPSRSRER